MVFFLNLRVGLRNGLSVQCHMDHPEQRSLGSPDLCVALWMASIFFNVNDCEIWSCYRESMHQPAKGQLEISCIGVFPQFVLAN